MAATKPPKRFGRVTWDGRLVVDVNKLYRSKQVRSALQKLDQKIESGKQQSLFDPLSTTQR